MSVDVYSGDLFLGDMGGGQFDCVCNIEPSQDEEGNLTITPIKWCVPDERVTKETAKAFADEVGKGIVDGINDSNQSYQDLIGQGIKPKDARQILKEQNQSEPR